MNLPLLSLRAFYHTLLLLLQFFFRVCPRQTDLTEACFGTNFLTRVDTGQRDTWLTSQDNWVMQYRCQWRHYKWQYRFSMSSTMRL
jgi:hypothetical protein